MADIAPELLRKVKSAFEANIKSNARAAQILADIEAGAATYQRAGEYAYEVGNDLANAFRACITPEALPDGKMYQNIAEKVVSPMLAEDHKMVSSAAVRVQQLLNDGAGIGMEAQASPLSKNRVTGIIRKISNAPSYKDVSWALGDPVRTFSQSVVDDTLYRNVKAQGGFGLKPKIVRRSVSSCCPWCDKIAGTYTYPDVPKDVYRRHGNCRCVVEYDPKSGKRQNVWSKKWETQSSSTPYKKGDAAKENRIAAMEAKQSYVDELADHPGRLSSADPDMLRDRLRANKIRTFDLKSGGYSADLGGGRKIIYDGQGYAISVNGKTTWSGKKI